MVVLRQHLPDLDIQPMGPNVKIYTGALGSDILSVLDGNGLDAYPIPQIMDSVEPVQQIVQVRHLQSKYNEYKARILQTDLYKNFLVELDPQRKKKFALDLLDDFRTNVGLDYTTQVSTEGHKQGEKLGILYSSLIAEYPDLFPTRIIVSPYLRTRTTAHYFLKNVQGLDMDVDELINEHSVRDMVIGSFHGKEIVLQLSDDVRERDHGADVAPSYLRKYINGLSDFPPFSGLPDDDSAQLHYYTSDGGGEAQTQVNQRGSKHFDDVFSNSLHEKQMVFTHHLFTLALVNNIVKGTYRTFFNMDRYWRPLNGSMSFFSTIPKTQMGQENKLRIAGYNLMLEK